MDIEIWDTYLALLFEKNLIIIYDLAKSQSEKTNERSKKKPLEQPKENSYFDKPVFRAKFEDATESISQLFFIKDFVKKVIEDSSNEDDS